MFKTINRDNEAIRERLRQALELTRFEQWLATKPADETVGVSTNGDRCPIANYLVETLAPGDLDWAYVDYSEVGAGSHQTDTGGYIRQRPWSTRFAQLVDQQGDDRPITAEVARALLAEVKQSNPETH